MLEIFINHSGLGCPSLSELIAGGFQDIATGIYLAWFVGYCGAGFSKMLLGLGIGFFSVIRETWRDYAHDR